MHDDDDGSSAAHVLCILLCHASAKGIRLVTVPSARSVGSTIPCVVKPIFVAPKEMLINSNHALPALISCKCRLVTLVSKRSMRAGHIRTTTPKHCILNCFLSKIVLNHSKAFNPCGMLVTAAEVALSPSFRLTLLAAALATEPPVPLIADTAKLVVCMMTSVSVALPLKYAAAVCESALVLMFHRGSNQSALKSKMEKTRTNSRMLQ